MNIKDKIRAVTLIVSYLEKGDRKKIFLISYLNVVLAIFDLLGVMTLGILSAIAVQSSKSLTPGTRLSWIINAMNMENLGHKSQIYILAMGALTVLVLKTLFSALVSRRMLNFLSDRAAKVSTNLVKTLLEQPVSYIQSRSSQEYSFAINTGSNYSVLGILGNLTKIFSDSVLIVIVSCALLVIDWKTALSILFLFFLTVIFLNNILRRRARVLGKDFANQTVEGFKITLNMINSIKEIYIRGSAPYFAQVFKFNRDKLAITDAKSSFISIMSRYVFEVVVVFSAFIVVGIQLITTSPARGAAVATMFLAGISRVAPSALSIQQTLTTLENYFSKIEPTQKLMKDFQDQRGRNSINLPTEHLISTSFNAEIELKNVSFEYRDADQFNISKINLTIAKGEFIAIVGPSGGGKSTLLDLMSGVLEPNSGDVLISGLNPRELIRKFPGLLGYVPQEISVLPLSVWENINLGFTEDPYKENQYSQSLQLAHLNEVIDSLPNGIETILGEKGFGLSGGQKQRLAIARMLFTNPQIIFLDEVTNALDAETENAVSETLSTLRGEKTMVIISHRLSTVRNADRILFVENGNLIEGTNFEDLKKRVPRFEIIANLQGF